MAIIKDLTLERMEALAPGVSVGKVLGASAVESIVAKAKRRSSPDYPARLAGALDLIARTRDGDPGASQVFSAAMSTDDFGSLFGDVIERLVEPGYNQWPSTWQQVAARQDLPDFRLARRIQMGGADQALAIVAEGEEYPGRSRTDSDYTWSVAKYGAFLEYTWETGVNDDLGALNDDTRLLGIAAGKTEDKVVSSVYVGASGPSAWYATNRVTSNPVLSYAAIKTALTQLNSRVDPVTGEPIFIDAVSLVVGTGLAATAEDILNTQFFDMPDGTGTRRVANKLSSRLKLVVNPWVGAIATSNADTSWWMFANPAMGRPAIVAGSLRGQATPQVTDVEIKRANDTARIYVRHCFGAAEGDKLATIASAGTG